jgi:DNA-binding GntR family transcriptional regulator
VRIQIGNVYRIILQRVQEQRRCRKIMILFDFFDFSRKLPLAYGLTTIRRAYSIRLSIIDNTFSNTIAREGDSYIMETVDLVQTPISLSEHIYISLKKKIMKGELPPGHRLIVLEIAKEFSVSQAPVREALERLKQEGLIVGKTNKGSVVSEITAKEIRDIYELRQLVEGHALRATMQALTEKDISCLEQIIEGMRASVDDGDPYRLVELDMAFHGYFYERSGNALLQDIWNSIKTKIMRFITITNQDHKGYFIPDSHLELLDLIKTGDMDLTEEKLIRGFDFYKHYTG